VAVQADGQSAGLGVEGGDGAAAAIGHRQLGDGVLAAHDPVSDGQLAVLDLERLGAEATLGGQEFLAGGVEPIHLGPPCGQHHQLLSRVPFGLLPGRPPILEQGQGGGRFGSAATTRSWAW
jgi:hypothetical protein